jgi:hypothetical protein
MNVRICKCSDVRMIATGCRPQVCADLQMCRCADDSYRLQALRARHVRMGKMIISRKFRIRTVSLFLAIIPQ